MASSQNTEQLLAQLANFTTMAQFANLTPEQLAKFSPEQITILVGAHATGASTAVPVPFVAPPLAGGSGSSGEMKVSQDTVSVDDTGKASDKPATKTPEQMAKARLSSYKTTLANWERKLEVKKNNLKEYPKDRTYQNGVNTATKKVAEWKQKVEAAKAEVEAAKAEVEAAESKRKAGDGALGQDEIDAVLAQAGELRAGRKNMSERPLVMKHKRFSYILGFMQEHVDDTQKAYCKAVIEGGTYKGNPKTVNAAQVAEDITKKKAEHERAVTTLETLQSIRIQLHGKNAASYRVANELYVELIAKQERAAEEMARLRAGASDGDAAGGDDVEESSATDNESENDSEDDSEDDSDNGLEKEDWGVDPTTKKRKRVGSLEPPKAAKKGDVVELSSGDEAGR